MVVAGDHFIQHVDATLSEYRACQRFHTHKTTPHRNLAPEKHSVLVEQIDPELALRIVRAAHNITAHVGQNVQILQHQLRWKSKSPLRVLFMTIHALQV